MFFQSGWGLGVAKKFVLFNEIVISNKNIFSQSGLVCRTVSQNIAFFQSGWGGALVLRKSVGLVYECSFV